MSKEQNKNHSNSARKKPHSFNAGLADGLSGISFESSRSSPNCAKEVKSYNEQNQSTDESSSFERLLQNDRRLSNKKRNINTALNDGFASIDSDMFMSKGVLAENSNKECFSSKRREKSLNSKGYGKKGEKLPSNKLRPREDLPEWESTKNFVFILFNGYEYSYPIHSWVPVMELCEMIYTDVVNHTLIRTESRKAIKSVVEEYCKRGQYFDLIPRSKIEVKVRRHLYETFKNDLYKKRDQLQSSSKKIFATDLPQYQPQNDYEERIRAYRVRNPNDAKKFTDLVRKKLEDYIVKKAKRVGEHPTRTLSGAFTHKQEDSRTVWVGLDYGTKNVKVAFRDGDEDDNSVILELNPSAHGINKYMMSPVTLVKGDRIIYRKHDACWCPSWKHALSYYYGETFAKDDAEIRAWLDNCIKQNEVFSTRSIEELVLFFTSIHLAFILGTVGNAIRGYYRERGINDDLAFRVFMCAPVAALDQQLSQSVFMDCLTLADEMHGVLDFSSGDISVQDAFDAYDQASCLGILLEERTKRRSRVVPEVLAEIASFAQSKAAREGIYALVDVGAGTLDLNVFRVVNFMKDQDVRTPIFAASCHPNGVNHLESVLAEALEYDLEIYEAQFEKQKSLRQFPDINALVRADEKTNQTELYSLLEKAHGEYCYDVARRTRLTWAEAWKKKGLERKEWTSLTMFLCGGGANIQNLQKHLEAGMPERIIQRIKHGVLPCPSENEFVRPPEFPEEDFHRVAVAYGLTFGSNLDPYIAPSEIAKVRLCRETYDIESCYISKDMV